MDEIAPEFLRIVLICKRSEYQNINNINDNSYYYYYYYYYYVKNSYTTNYYLSINNMESAVNNNYMNEDMNYADNNSCICKFETSKVSTNMKDINTKINIKTDNNMNNYINKKSRLTVVDKLTLGLSYNYIIIIGRENMMHKNVCCEITDISFNRVMSEYKKSGNHKDYLNYLIDNKLYKSEVKK